MAVEDLEHDDIECLIKLIEIVNKRTNKIVPVLRNINNDSLYERTPKDDEYLKSWYTKPEDITDISIKCAKNMIFIVCKRLSIPYE
jgi:hypothetical protein